MHKNKNLHQQAAAISKAKILNAARIHFLRQGFSGTSISQIAKEAEVPQSLLYHYYKNKEDLWRGVKANIIASSHMEPADAIDSLDEFVQKFLTDRYQLHAKNPDLVRLLMWQAVENSNTSLSGTSSDWLQGWVRCIEKLQDQKKITKNFQAEEIVLLMNGIVWAPFATISGDAFAKSSEKFCEKMSAHVKKWLAPDAEC